MKRKFILTDNASRAYMNFAILSIATSSSNALLANLTMKTKTTCVDCVQQIDSMATFKQRVIAIYFVNHHCSLISYFDKSGNYIVFDAADEILNKIETANSSRKKKAIKIYGTQNC